MRIFLVVASLLFPLLAFSAEPAPRLAPELNDIPLHRAPPVDPQLRARTAPSGVVLAADVVALPLQLADGQWSRSASHRLWQLRVRADAALSLGLEFSSLRLPAGGQLRLLDPSSGRVLDRFDSSELSPEGVLYTPLYSGNELIVQLRLPADSTDDDADLTLAKVYVGRMEAELILKSGSCNIDVACAQADAWSNEVRAAVKLQVTQSDGVYYCSGALVNNTAQNDVPLLLSANHCGYNSSNDNSVIAIFNYETSSCGGSPNGSESQRIIGTTFLDAHAGSDFSLLRLSSTPPASFDAYLAGWNISSTPASSGAGIHHPAGDEKRISLFSSALSATRISIEGIIVDTWAVNWSAGITEGGSSGSGLWDQNHRMVGVLTGGASSCSNPDQTDYYGRLNVAWNNGLQSFLDPIGSGATQLTGKDLGGGASNQAPIAVDDLFSVVELADGGSVTLDVLANDVDADNDSLSISSVGQLDQGGSVSITGGLLSYSPAVGFSGYEHFDYSISDGNGGSDSASVTVAVDTAANTAPVANDDNFSATIDADAGDVYFTIPVLDNDTDAENHSLTVTAISSPSPAVGSLTLDGGIIYYVPQLGYDGTIAFTYTITDELGGTDSANVSLTLDDRRGSGGSSDSSGGGAFDLLSLLLALPLLLWRQLQRRSRAGAR